MPKTATPDKWFAFAFGVVFVSVLLYLATVVANPTPLAIKVYITVLALAAAGVGAVLPGQLNVHFKNWLRAGGGLALFAVVYLSEPAIGRAVVKTVEPSAPARPVVDEFLRAIDSSDPAKSWKLLPSTARDQVTGGEPAWRELYRNSLTPLGPLKSRELVGQAQAVSPSGAPPGLYRVFTYRSRHEADAGPRLETVVVRASSSNEWEVYTYQISVSTLAGVTTSSSALPARLQDDQDGADWKLWLASVARLNSATEVNSGTILAQAGSAAVDHWSPQAGTPYRQQQCSAWCWAAAIQMAAATFDDHREQCAIASLVVGANCCQPGACYSFCNRQSGPPQVISVALSALGHHGNEYSRSLTEEELIEALDSGYPVLVANTNLATGHFVVVYKHTVFQDRNLFKVHDPLPDKGTRTLSYAQLNAYSGMPWLFSWVVHS